MTDNPSPIRDPREYKNWVGGILSSTVLHDIREKIEREKTARHSYFAFNATLQLPKVQLHSAFHTAVIRQGPFVYTSGLDFDAISAKPVILH